MCLGGPQAPEVEYTGPSDDQIEANRQALATYEQQINQQQMDFQKQLQDQIDKADAETERLKAEFAAESAAEQAAATAASSVYITQAKQTEMPEGAQTTAAVMKKKQPKSNLKISTAGTANSAGTGLNIGV